MATAVLACAIAASVLLLCAAWCDVATRTVPDEISVALAALGLAMRAPDGFAAVAVSMALAVALWFACLPLHARGAFGGADMKLVSALAVGFPPAATADFLLATSMAGGVLGLFYLSARRLPQPSPLTPQPLAWPARRVFALERRRWHRRGPIPYAVAIASGGILTLSTAFGG